jgi:membrane protein
VSLPTTRGIGRSAWQYAALRAQHGFVRHRGLDSAAALTFFATLALFPGALVVVSAFATVENRSGAVDNILSVVGEFVTADTVETLRAPINSLLTIGSPWLALVIGVVLTVWSLSGYATAFGRAMNAVYEVQEGRRVLVFRILMILLSVLLMVGYALIAVILLTTPRAAAAIGKTIGIGEPWLTAWNFGKWPLLAILVFVIIGVLYYATPNVRHLRVRWVSWGALFAIVVWALATVAFGVYVATVATYPRVYGWLGGAIVLLLWLYLSNLVLVLGAEVDAELVRVRQLTAGIPAEETIQLPARGTARTLRLASIRSNDVAEGRAIRELAEREQ